jgi:uncharacterized membrane protein
MRISYKLATYAILLFFVIIAIIFYFKASNLPVLVKGATIGPEYFPKLNSILLLILCILSFFTTIRKKERYIKIEKPNLAVFTLILLSLFVAAWQLLGLFYISSFLLLLTLFMMFNPTKNSLKKVGNMMAISLLVVLFIYLIFEKLLHVRF